MRNSSLIFAIIYAKISCANLMQLLALSSSSHRQSPAPPRFSPTAATLASKCLKLLDTSSSSSSLELQLMSMASNCAPRSSLAKWQSARSEMSWPPPPAYGTRGPTGSPACCASPARCSDRRVAPRGGGAAQRRHLRADVTPVVDAVAGGRRLRRVLCWLAVGAPEHEALLGGLHIVSELVWNVKNLWDLQF